MVSVVGDSSVRHIIITIHIHGEPKFGDKRHSGETHTLSMTEKKKPKQHKESERYEKLNAYLISAKITLCRHMFGQRHQQQRILIDLALAEYCPGNIKRSTPECIYARFNYPGTVSRRKCTCSGALCLETHLSTRLSFSAPRCASSFEMPACAGRTRMPKGPNEHLRRKGTNVCVLSKHDRRRTAKPANGAALSGSRNKNVVFSLCRPFGRIY